MLEGGKRIGGLADCETTTTSAFGLGTLSR
jgi:hypothetical protein